METNTSSKRKRSQLISAAAAALMLVPGTAGAVSLYWATTPVHTSKLNQCLSFAQDAMRDLNVQNIRLGRDEVAGTSGQAYAAITCIGTNPVTAVVMVAGEQDGPTGALRDGLKQKVAGIVNID
ncbi:hypothetical protein RZS28_16115 [Methylocapsa polymorpha]|uniref:Uncharacterized protein n=1 Tax=Methylocapsa polymorpha TaxID=3080828 RepID=A0ABZ0HRY5_9HYPH|nr:hypothetical protein RZS28_16115 [Methylocapsa sp. RX1]